MTEGKPARVPAAKPAQLQLLALQSIERFAEQRKELLSRRAIGQIVTRHAATLVRRKALFAYGPALMVHPDRLDEFLLELGTAQAARRHHVEDAQPDDPVAAMLARVESEGLEPLSPITMDDFLASLGFAPGQRSPALRRTANAVLTTRLGFSKKRPAGDPARAGGRRLRVYLPPAKAGQVINFTGPTTNRSSPCVPGSPRREREAAGVGGDRM